MAQKSLPDADVGLEATTVHEVNPHGKVAYCPLLTEILDALTERAAGLA